MRPLLVSYSDLSGGAARAAHRLHRAIRAQGVGSSMLVMRKLGGDPDVAECTTRIPLGKLRVRFRPVLAKTLMRLHWVDQSVQRSSNVIPSPLFKQIETGESDIVNLHWINCEALSVGQIGRLRKPVVFTLHDMWAFCGAEHYVAGDEVQRFRDGYNVKERPAGSAGLDIDRWTWRRKRKHWKKPRHVVCPSRWLAKSARDSVLMRDWFIHVVPNVLDVDLFQPHDKAMCRRILGLPTDRPLIGFGAIGGGRDPRKGFDLLTSALRVLVERGSLKGAECVVFGEDRPNNAVSMPLETRFMGYLHDDWTLVLLYNALDVMVVPSRQEAFGQSASEAQACGCPVVAYNCTGLADVVEHANTGYLATPFSAEELAKGISWVLEDAPRRARLGAEARLRATSLWSAGAVVPQYMDIYHRAIQELGT